MRSTWGEMQCRSGVVASGDVGQSRAKVVQHSDKVRQDLRPAGGGVWVVRRAPTFLGERSGLGTNNGHAGEKPGDLPVQQVTRVELIIFSTLQRTRLSSSTVDAHNTTVQSCRFVARTQNSNSEQFRFRPKDLPVQSVQADGCGCHGRISPCPKLHFSRMSSI